MIEMDVGDLVTLTRGKMVVQDEINYIVYKPSNNGMIVELTLKEHGPAVHYWVRGDGHADWIVTSLIREGKEMMDEEARMINQIPSGRVITTQTYPKHLRFVDEQKREYKGIQFLGTLGSGVEIAHFLNRELGWIIEEVEILEVRANTVKFMGGSMPTDIFKFEITRNDSPEYMIFVDGTPDTALRPGDWFLLDMSGRWEVRKDRNLLKTLVEVPGLPTNG